MPGVAGYASLELEPALFFASNDTRYSAMAFRLSGGENLIHTSGSMSGGLEEPAYLLTFLPVTVTPPSPRLSSGCEATASGGAAPVSGVGGGSKTSAVSPILLQFSRYSARGNFNGPR